MSGRRALVVYGAGHLISTGRLGANTLVSILKGDSNLRIFTISNSYPDLSRFQAGAAWPVPGLILVKDTTVGTEPSEAGSPLEWEFDAVLLADFDQTAGHRTKLGQHHVPDSKIIALAPSA